MTQYEQVASWLSEKGSITQKEAYDNFGIMRLGAIIYTMRQHRYNITTVYEKGKTRTGIKTKWARYVFEK